MNKFSDLEWISKFDDEQYEILFDAHKQGINIDGIDNPDFNTTQMMVLIQAAKEGVDIKKFNDPSYNYLQLDEIRKALIQGLNIMPLISPTLGEKEIQQVRLGLENKLSMKQIKEFNKTIYTHRQMSQLRQGLEQGLDIRQFNNPDLNYKQMQEIRLSKTLKESLSNINKYIINPNYNIELAREMSPYLDVFSNTTVIKPLRDNCGPIAWDLYFFLLKNNFNNVKVVNGVFIIDNLNIIDKKDFTKEEQRKIVNQYGDLSSNSLIKYIKSNNLEEEFKKINHYWVELDNLIIDAGIKMFYGSMDSDITYRNYKK